MYQLMYVKAGSIALLTKQSMIILHIYSKRLRFTKFGVLFQLWHYEVCVFAGDHPILSLSLIPHIGKGTCSVMAKSLGAGEHLCVMRWTWYGICIGCVCVDPVIVYNGKFLRGPMFRVFCGWSPNHENYTRKISLIIQYIIGVSMCFHEN